MEYLIEDTRGFTRRKYSNKAMRGLHKYIDYYNLKVQTEGYNTTLDSCDVYITDKRLRTTEEIEADYQTYLEEEV